jgi:tellurite resistance protein
MQKNLRIKNFPISFFSIVMGLTGFSISLQKGIEILHLSSILPNFFLYFAISVFFVLTISYIRKICLFPSLIKAEFFHPIKINFFPTFSISILLFSVAFLNINLTISKYLCLVGMILHLIFSIFIISIWIQHKFAITHMNPSWFIPAVGNILIPVTAVTHFPLEISYFFFSVGFFFWGILLVVFFYRIFFHEPLAEKLLPTLFILIAPPSIGFIAYFKLSAEVNDFGKILYYFALFLTILMFSQIKMFTKIKYYLSWWAYSFPLAAISIASALMYHTSKAYIFKSIYLTLLLILTIVIAILIIKTLTYIRNKKICIEEE